VFAARAGVAGGEWDSALQRLGGHFLQSTAWQRVQAELGYAVASASADDWMWAGAIRSGRFPRYLYVPYGPTAGSGATLPALRSAIESARSGSLDFVRVEPVGADALVALSTAGARTTRSIQPRWTWVLDIDVDEAVLRRGLSAGHRGSINAAERRGISIRCSREPADIEVFLTLHEKAAGRSGFRGQSQRYHRVVANVLMPLGVAAIYVAVAAGTPVASALCFDFGATRYYAHAASDPWLGRRLGAAAPLVWQMILDARALGMGRFDFWGVSRDPQSGRQWAGFTQFKQAFGGELLERAGTWDLPVRALRHRMYRVAYAMRR
jgi:hypothetical protein